MKRNVFVLGFFIGFIFSLSAVCGRTYRNDRNSRIIERQVKRAQKWRLSEDTLEEMNQNYGSRVKTKKKNRKIYTSTIDNTILTWTVGIYVRKPGISETELLQLVSNAGAQPSGDGDEEGIEEFHKSDGKMDDEEGSGQENESELSGEVSEMSVSFDTESDAEEGASADAIFGSKDQTNHKEREIHYVSRFNGRDW